jgi:hypothetical protein
MAVPFCLCIAATVVAVQSYGGWRPVRGMLLALTAGGLAAGLPLAVWITVHASWTGLFVYHVYFNQVIYARLIGYSPWDVFNGAALSFSPAMRPHTFAVILGILGLLGAWRGHKPGRAGRVAGMVLAGAAVLALNPKGNPDFPDSAQMTACFGIRAVALAARLGHVVAFG